MWRLTSVLQFRLTSRWSPGEGTKWRRGRGSDLTTLETPSLSPARSPEVGHSWKLSYFSVCGRNETKKCENNNWALRLAGKVTAYFSNFTFLFWVTEMRVSSIVKYESNAHLKVHLQAHQRPRWYGGKRAVCTMTHMNWWAWLDIFLKRYKAMRQNG